MKVPYNVFIEVYRRLWFIECSASYFWTTIQCDTVCPVVTSQAAGSFTQEAGSFDDEMSKKYSQSICDELSAAGEFLANGFKYFVNVEYDYKNRIKALTQ